MSDLRKHFLLLMMLGIVLILEYSTFLAGMNMLPGFQQSPPEDIMGSVQVISEPDGALVFFDGINTGQTTPFMQMEVLPGNHTVTVILEGYHPQSEQFEVFSEKITHVRLILVPVNMTPLLLPVQRAPTESPPPPPVGGQSGDSSPSSGPSYAPGPVVVPAPEFPSPAIPAVMVTGCFGVVLLLARYKD